MLRSLYYRLSPKQRLLLRKVVYAPIDLFRKRHELEPPKGYVYTGPGNYIEIGEIFFGYFKAYGNIQPDSRILDIGSGIGRMAIPFTEFLNENGTYKGFDVVAQGVDWCTANITSKYPNFTFKFTPLKNDLYNLNTNAEAKDFTFPYDNSSFDFAFLTSVFTHMMPADVLHYLGEIYRVLDTKKICLATFFILDETSRKHMSSSKMNFKVDRQTYALMDEKVKEANVAFDKDYIFAQFEAKGFQIVNYFPGTWSGRTENTLSYQDIIVLKKN
ncbi:class I SAM-dependent methyltransferase [Kordia sp.]|uniref:class I SAM-dependent methyltransferase n=1 Tax=Kordia sp. TaxID=1965332 RepID=UPI0025C1343F|nr:class I SAM-dependent methyltransferase [Kordia sp.]MCH2193193.1 class I SAM-dependent methyltransferase [Kordia sp.]